jgi:hypothetical protein
VEVVAPGEAGGAGAAMGAPRSTSCPSWTPIAERWPYRLISPYPWSITTAFPKIPK